MGGTIMKKTYMKPELVVVNIEVTSMLCLSAGISSESQGNGAALGRPGFYYDEEEY